MSDRARRLQAADCRGVFHITGGGSLFLSEMLTTPGASRTVLDIRVPYAEAALHQLLGKLSSGACSDATARALAMSAFMHARTLSDQNVFGLGCTASLATDREKKGAHRAHLALQTQTTTYSLQIGFSADRETEETLLSDALWGLCLILSGVEPATTIRTTNAADAWQDLVLGRQTAIATAPHDGKLLVPGSFNPLHDGHRQMIDIAEARTGRVAALELSIGNVDKPPLDYQEISARLNGISRTLNRPVWLTRMPTFVEKATRFPGATFVVGVDTIVRIAEGRYYAKAEDREAAFEFFARQGIRFMVFGRTMEGEFRTLSSLVLPRTLADVCIGIREDEFRADVSSSAIRSGANTRPDPAV